MASCHVSETVQSVGAERWSSLNTGEAAPWIQHSLLEPSLQERNRGLWRRGIRHDKVHCLHALTDFSSTLFFLVGARDNNITLLLTVRSVLGYMLCWQELKSLRYFPLGAHSHPSWFVLYMQLCCLGLLASWLMCKGDSWRSTVRLAMALGGPYHVPEHALDAGMLSDLGSATCHLCPHFPFCEMLLVALISQTVWSCAAAKLSMRQQLTLISCVVKPITEKGEGCSVTVTQRILHISIHLEQFCRGRQRMNFVLCPSVFTYRNKV